MPDKHDLSSAVPVLIDARGRIEALFERPRVPAAKSANAVDLWRNRRLASHYAMIFVDSMTVKVHGQGLLSSKRIYQALGISDDGSKDILGAWVFDAADRDPWPGLLAALRTRGVEATGILVVEDAAVLRAARQVFPGARLFAQPKQLVQEALTLVSGESRVSTGKALTGYLASSAAGLSGLLELEAVRKNPALGDYWLRRWGYVAPLIALPAAMRQLLCTTSAVESVTEKLRRRGISKRSSFPSAEVAVQELLYVLRDASASWKVSLRKWNAVRLELLAGDFVLKAMPTVDLS